MKNAQLAQSPVIGLGGATATVLMGCWEKITSCSFGFSASWVGFGFQERLSGNVIFRDIEARFLIVVRS
jgi:hypothetical protein